AAIVLLEYTITFSAEVELFWMKRCTGAAILFFANRYTSLLHNLMNSTNCFGVSTSKVSLFSRSNIVFALLQYTSWAGFSSLRAFALSRNRAISSAVFILSLVPMGTN
ncbi:hypothetical protein C8Q74DRAFT_1162649, partial [Fomes fomentarius]